MARGVVAPGRRSPTNVTGDFSGESAKAAQPASSQEKGQTQSSKFRNVAVTPGRYNEGNQVRVTPSNKGTDVVGRPSALGLASRQGTKPASENPDGQNNRPGSRRK